jgi:hypothetical protein
VTRATPADVCCINPANIVGRIFLMIGAADNATAKKSGDGTIVFGPA